MQHILLSAKKEQEHRHSIHKKQVDAFCKSIEYVDTTNRIISTRAQIYATLIVSLFLIASVVLAMSGITSLAIGALGTAVVGVVSLIIAGKKKENKEDSSED